MCPSLKAFHFNIWDVACCLCMWDTVGGSKETSWGRSLESVDDLCVYVCLVGWLGTTPCVLRWYRCREGQWGGILLPVNPVKKAMSIYYHRRWGASYFPELLPVQQKTSVFPVSQTLCSARWREQQECPGEGGGMSLMPDRTVGPGGRCISLVSSSWG